MPRYEFQVDVPAGTPETSAATAEITVEEQVITRARRFAPPGSDGVVHAVFRFGEDRILPTDDSNTLLLPGHRPFAEVDYDLPGTPTTVNCKAWAPNSQFEHTVTVEFDAVDPDDIADPVRIVGVGQGLQATTQPARGSAEELTE